MNLIEQVPLRIAVVANGPILVAWLQVRNENSPEWNNVGRISAILAMVETRMPEVYALWKEMLAKFIRIEINDFLKSKGVGPIDINIVEAVDDRHAPSAN